ncbi:MAG: hypothetical protein A4E73_02414 [Syntrophaceae bacterium PtaU1.Bin231]|nr:MAG: hypothetical protein A4E73_02414 [Syntrophaceae bacterium PtaU1.Bin231]
MGTFYLDFINGNDANDGSSWANAWKTFRSGATEARIAPGDLIKIAKTPAEASLGINMTLTEASNVITLASALTANICTCENNWTAASGDVTCSNQSSLNQGSYSAQSAISAAFGTGLASYWAMTATDFSGYQNISFCIYSNVDVAANSLQITLCSDNAGATPVDSFTIDRPLRAGKRHFFTLKKGSALGSSIQSVALNVLVDLGGSTANIRLDNILACNSLHLLTLIGKQGGPWFPIRCIDGTSVTMGFGVYYNSWTNYSWYRATESGVAAYVVEPAIVENYSSAYNGLIVQDAGNADADTGRITFAGGYDTSSGDQDGWTWCFPECVGDVDGGFNSCGINLNNKDYLSFEHLHMGGFYQGVYFGSGLQRGVHFDTYHSVCQRPWDTSQPSTTGGALIRWTGGTWKWSSAEQAAIPCGNGAYQGGHFFADNNLDIYYGNAYSCPIKFVGTHIVFLGKVTVKFFNAAYADVGVAFTSCFETYVNEIETEKVAYSVSFESCGHLVIGKLTSTSCTYLARQVQSEMTDVTIQNLVVPAGSPTDLSRGSVTEGSYQFGGMQDFVNFDRYKADNRYKAVGRYGNISDHITGGEAADWAYGGSGLSWYFDPLDVNKPLVKTFFAPVSAVETSLKMQVRKSASAATCKLLVSIHGCGITPVKLEEVTLTDSWAEYESTAFTPARAGFVIVSLYAYDGSTSGNIGIDDIVVAATA